MNNSMPVRKIEGIRHLRDDGQLLLPR
jgi:hypothetical protein